MLSPYAYKVTSEQRAELFADADRRVRQLERQNACSLSTPYDNIAASRLAGLFPAEAHKMGLHDGDIALLSWLHDGPGCELMTQAPDTYERAEEVAARVDREFGEVEQRRDASLKYWRGVRSRNKSRM